MTWPDVHAPPAGADGKGVRRALALLLLALVAVPAPAAAQPEGGGTRVVATADAYRQAVTELGADEAGPHRIVLADDIWLGTVAAPVYASTQPLTLEGRGHVLGGRGIALLDGDGGGRLTVDGVTFRGGSSGIVWGGVAVIRDSRFLNVGRGMPPGGRGPTISIFRLPHVPARLLLTDVVVRNSLSTLATVNANGKLTATRLTFRQGDGRTMLWARSTLRLVDSVVGGNRSVGAAVASVQGDVELVRTSVTGTRRPEATNEPTVDAGRTLRLDHAVVRGNQPSVYDAGVSALRAEDLVARWSIVRHERRACWITGTTTARHSIASDRSCGFS